MCAERLTFGLERTLDEDVAYGFRMLVDMAERALSESPFLDPTTAVQAIDRIHDGLRQLAQRRLHDGRHFDARGVCRLVVPTMGWDEYVHLAFDEIRMAGAASPRCRVACSLHSTTCSRWRPGSDGLHSRTSASSSPLPSSAWIATDVTVQSR